MKVAIGSQPYDGPWGGGNRFVASLCAALRNAGHVVVHELGEPGIDLALMIDPRTRSPNVTFGPGDLWRHTTFRDRNTIVIHRINECDERKGEPFINDRLVRANDAADVTVFVAGWLRHLPVWQEHLREPNYVVLNGADEYVFNRSTFTPWSGSGPIKFVTHHWGFHPNKGFDVYAYVDELLDQPAWRERLQMTFVGNLPKGFKFKNIRYVAPLDGADLARELSSHHAYLTGSINEPGGNHQNEGALSGLPLLYRNSGCMPEYCDGFGVSFEGPGDVAEGIEAIIQDYPALVVRMESYPHTAANMTRAWLDLFEQLIAQREKLVAQRRPWRHPLRVLANQVPL